MDKLYGLIFDVDGVIVDTEGPTAAATIKVFEDLFGVKGVKREDFEAGLGKGAEAYILAAAKVHGLEMTAEQLAEADRMREDNFIELVEQSPLPAFAGVLELMEKALAEANFRLAIATSSSRRMSEPVLKGANVPYERMVYVTGSDVTHKKPNPEIFLKAADRVEIDSANCVIIEDTPGGVEAAKAAGANCIAVTNTAGPEVLRDADLISPSVEQIDIQTIIGLVEGRAR
jgi:HAD superfamily hydrolase (TIGR01509 family)